jgi:DnaJ-class molecular chaperone
MQVMKDYYEILGVEPAAAEEQIRKVYRRLALQHHPDRNPGDPGAEERFKEIAEAYGVLIDPDKRGQYDRWRHGARVREEATTEGFPFSREEVFHDLFGNPRSSQVFQDLFREFERAGVRFDQRFFDHVFFGGRGVRFNGVFFWGPVGHARVRVERPRYQERPESRTAPQFQPAGVLQRLGQKISHFLEAAGKALLGEPPGPALRPEDLSYSLAVPSDQARKGSWVQVAVDRGRGKETLRVKIPAGTRSGTRLRLKGRGRLGDRRSGDLYLTIHLA